MKRSSIRRWVARPTHIAPTNATSPSQAISEGYISIVGLSKSFIGRTSVVALANIDLDIADGEFVSVIGPSGCGKSTLLMLVAGLEPTSSGRIVVGGQLVERPISNIGIVFQQDVLLEWRSAIDN